MRFDFSESVFKNSVDGVFDLISWVQFRTPHFVHDVVHYSPEYGEWVRRERLFFPQSVEYGQGTP